MTDNTGKPRKNRKKYQHINKNGARLHRRDFIETEYINGVYDQSGNKVIRNLTQEEVDWLDKFYKEYVHGTFNTDEESSRLFKEAKKVYKTKDNLEYFKNNGTHSKEVKTAISKFNKKSKKLGNVFHDFFQQRDINSDDYKRKFDIQNNSAKGLQLESFEDIQYAADFDEDEEATTIEDLVTESEDV